MFEVLPPGCWILVGCANLPLFATKPPGRYMALQPPIMEGEELSSREKMLLQFDLRKPF
jgi:hypothetical protein